MTKTNGKMTPTFDPTTYSNLLAQAAPKVIETEAEYERMLALTEQLHFTKNRTAEERTLYKLLVTLVELYESERYSIPESKPHEVLQHIMAASGMRQADLVGIIGSSGVVSEIVNGKRAISKAQAKILGEQFKVSPSLFL
jgi:HTH-type transcriptional regulator / antitoxin HigA